MRLRPGRNVTYLELILPRGSRVDRVRYPLDGGSDMGQGRSTFDGDWRSWRFWTVPREGIEVSVIPAGDEPVQGWIADRGRGLPVEGRALIESRPATAVPSQSGDTTVVYRSVTIPAPDVP